MKKIADEKLIIASAMLEIGLRISLPLVIMIMVGLWIDNRFGTKPLFILIMVGLSLFTSAYGIFITLKKYAK